MTAPAVARAPETPPPVWRRRLASPRGWVGGALGLYVVSSAAALCAAGDEILPDGVYFWHAALLVLLGVSLFRYAFLRFREQGGGGTGPWVSAAALCLCLGLADAATVLLCVDTIGPGSPLCITHRRWQSTCVTHNEYRFWERDLAPYMAGRDPEAVVLAAVGDSFTWGQGMRTADRRFTNQLEARLRQAGEPRLTVLNFGRGGGSTRSETEWIKDPVARVRPATVLVFYLSNDIEAVQVLRPIEPAFGLLRRTLLRLSPTWNLVYFRFLAGSEYARGGNAYFMNLLLSYRDPETMAGHLADIDRMVRGVREIGAKPVFVILPFPGMWRDVEEDVRAGVYRRVAGQAAASGAGVVELQDLEQEFGADRFGVNPLDGHPNEAVHRRIAERVGAWLLEHREHLRR